MITTCSKGFSYHGYPYDFWRYELKDMKHIFSDCEILALEKDTQARGVFIKLRKPNNFKENNLSNYKLCSIVTDKKVETITDNDIRSLYFKLLIFEKRLKSFLGSIWNYMYNNLCS